MKAMNEIKVYEQLKEAWELSTQKHNYFSDAINSIKWDSTFEADGEMYFTKGKFVLTVENIDPFKEQWAPEVMFSDGGILSFL